MRTLAHTVYFKLIQYHATKQFDTTECGGNPKQDITCAHWSIFLLLSSLITARTLAPRTHTLATVYY